MWEEDRRGADRRLLFPAAPITGGIYDHHAGRMSENNVGMKRLAVPMSSLCASLALSSNRSAP